MTRIAATLGIAALGGLLVPAAHGDSMAFGLEGYSVSEPLLTVGESIGSYTPPGILDGLGAYRLDEDTVRVFANHELLNFRGYEYEVSDGMGGTFAMVGARVSFFDIDVDTKQIVDAGLAYDLIYDQLGNVATDTSFLSNDFAGFSRFCSSALFEPHQFGDGRGLEDRIYMTSEEDGGFFNSVGANEWGLDPETRSFWGLPDLGRGSWENVTEVDTGTTDYVAFILADDTSPFDFNPAAGDGDEAAPLYLYVGQKDPEGDFPARNGLRGGKLYVWVSSSGETSPLEFRGNDAGTLSGTWVQVDNTPGGPPSEDGSTGFDEYGYPVQGTLWIEARSLGAFGFSRPEDLSISPTDGSVAILASTGVDTYAIDPDSGDGADTFGTLYLIDCDFSDIDNPTAAISILYDGDDDPERFLRSPDNLDWADDGSIYVQEDKAETDSLSGEFLFGPDAVNPNEAGIVRIDPATRELVRVANIDRSVVLDGSIADPTQAVDFDAGFAGEWESSGIIDVSVLFDRDPGSFYIFNVQAHGIVDQNDVNPESRITDSDLVEGGQLLFMAFCPADLDGSFTVDTVDLLNLLAQWGPCDPDCNADIDGDGEVGATDLLELLAAFGDC